MKQEPQLVNFQQMHLTLAYQRPKSCFQRINTVQNISKTEGKKIINRPFTAVEKYQYSQKDQSEVPDRNLYGHACVNLSQKESNENGRKSTQKILVSSALRRPHASQYSQLDSQTLPEQGRLPRQPYRPKSASTMYSYTKRPVSASDASNHLGRPTKASLLRSKSPMEASSACSSSRTSAKQKKKACVVRKEYMVHQNLLSPKEVLDYMTSVHSYLTGARYNCSRFVDSKSKYKLGLYISKDDYKTFIMNKPKPEAKLADNDVPDVAQNVLESKNPNLDVVATGTNTDPHYLSVNKWLGADWSDNKRRKQMKPSTSDNRRLVSSDKGKTIKTQYVDYNTMVLVK